MASRYWFARRSRVGRPGSSMGPISTEGWIVVFAFVADMVVGGLGLLFFGLNGQFVAGIAMFVFLAIAGGAMFIAMAVNRGDKTNTIEDYRSGRVSNEQP